MEKFYSVGIERKNDEALIQSSKDYNQQKLMKGEFTPTEPFEMEITEGRKLYDIVGFQDTSNFAISERLYSLLDKCHVTGWRGYEVNIKGCNEKYYGFQVLGRCGKFDVPKESGFYIGYKFDYNSWDKSDFFSPDDTALIFCTKRVRDVLEKSKITNVELMDIDCVRAYSTGNA